MILRAKPILSFARLFSSASSPQKFDLIVIGGGSGGLSCSKTAADLGAKVALIDGVAPSPTGTKWGIGGTCANVGCIPKKLMHHAAVIGRELRHVKRYGWEGIEEEKMRHDWNQLVKVVDGRIKSNNFVYRVQLNEKKIKYINGFAEFVNDNTIMTTGVDKNKTQTYLQAPSIVISTGLRPRYPRIEGFEHGITSDDLFTLKTPPGKTLVVGGGYVALECAGLLSDLSHPVDLLIRSQPLKAFDEDCVEKVVDCLVDHDVRVRQGYEVEKVSLDDKKKRVEFTQGNGYEAYDTIIWAMGRDPVLETLKTNVEISKNGRIIANERDETSVKGVYAIGDIVNGREELTPLAIQSGQLLAKRLFGGSTQVVDYGNIPTTVFTPIELSTVGLTEKAAVEKYGEENVEVYHSYFKPFEYVMSEDEDSKHCYLKVICKREEPQKVLGLHFVGPNAAEVMQGFAVAIRVGITFNDLKSTIAIHPCSAEEFIKISVTKRSGNDPRIAGCCG